MSGWAAAGFKDSLLEVKQMLKLITYGLPFSELPIHPKSLVRFDRGIPFEVIRGEGLGAVLHKVREA